jgi:ABC-type cobalamin/Fe3+-siderophores transport system ATPase subunit
VWTERIKSLINYYKNNTIINEVKKVTLMLDEPDRNLDINNIKELYGLLTYEHPQVQLIVVLHNSSLIYKLSKLDYINFVEMTDGYINKIVNFIENEN